MLQSIFYPLCLFVIFYWTQYFYLVYSFFPNQNWDKLSIVDFPYVTDTFLPTTPAFSSKIIYPVFISFP